MRDSQETILHDRQCELPEPCFRTPVDIHHTINRHAG